MKEKDNIKVSTGIGFCELLTLIFVIAKIFNKVSFSWLWVFSPIWIPLVVLGAIYLVLAIIK